MSNPWSPGYLPHYPSPSEVWLPQTFPEPSGFTACSGKDLVGPAWRLSPCCCSTEQNDSLSLRVVLGFPLESLASLSSGWGIIRLKLKCLISPNHLTQGREKTKSGTRPCAVWTRMYLGIDMEIGVQHLLHWMTIERQALLRGTYSPGLQIDTLCQTQEARELTPRWWNSPVASLLLHINFPATLALGSKGLHEKRKQWLWNSTYCQKPDALDI